jgi:DHA1 family multidrug resistance protein-like MFS transporter
LTDATSSPRPAAPLPLLALSIFAANLGLGIIFPLVPHLAGTSTAGPAAVGWIFSSYSLTLVLAQVAGGVLADRLDEARVLRWALWAYVVTLIGFALSRDVPWLMLNRACEGAAVGLIIPCVMKLVVRSVPVERRGRGIGFVMGLGGTGFIIGPLLGGYLAQFGLALPFLAAALVAGVAAIGVSLGVKAGAPAPDPTPLPRVVAHELRHFGVLLATPAFLALVLPLMAFKANFSTLQAGLPLVGDQVLGVGVQEVSYLFVVTAVLFGLVQPVAGRLADRFPTGGLVVAMLALMGPLAAWLAFQHGYWAFLPAFAAYSACQSAGVLFALKHIGDGVGEGAQGRSFGLASAMGDIGMVILPSVLLPLYAWRHEALFLALGAVMWGFLIAFKLLGRQPSTVANPIQPPAV